MLRRNNNTNEHKVDFVIAGAQKSGTTALRASLFDHPQLCFSKKPELHFFDSGRNFLPVVRGFREAQYHRNFLHRRNGQLLGEKTPSYVYLERVPARIHKYNPRMKLIIVLRNPIDRAYSHYQMKLRNEGITESFMERLQMEIPLTLEALWQLSDSLIARGLYTQQIRRLQRFFPDDQLFFLKNEELRHDTAQTLRAVCSFLGVNPELLPAVASNELGPKREYAPMGDEERDVLSGVFYREVKKLQDVLGWDLEDWLMDMKPRVERSNRTLEFNGGEV